MRHNLSQWWERRQVIDKVFVCAAIALTVLVLVSVVVG